MRKDRTQKPLEQTRLVILLKPHPNLTFVNSVKPSHMQKINKKKNATKPPQNNGIFIDISYASTN